MANFKSLLTISILGIILLLSGCASGTSLSDSQHNVAPLAEGKARILIFRDSSIIGAASHPMISINGIEIQTCRPNAVFIADLPPGRNYFESEILTDSRLNLNLRAGETRYVECVSGLLPVLKVPLREVSQEKGKRATKNLVFQGSYSQ